MASATQIRTVPRPDCFLCGATGAVLHQGLTDRLFSAPGTWYLRKCSASNCELVWLDPFPITEDVPKAYETYYTHDRCADPGLDGVSLVRDFLYRTYRVTIDRKSTRLNSSHVAISYAVFCLKKKNKSRS